MKLKKCKGTESLIWKIKGTNFLIWPGDVSPAITMKGARIDPTRAIADIKPNPTIKRES